MELFLNLAWGIFAATAILSWAHSWSHSDLKTVPFAKGLQVIVCILVLLFPVISISDDLAQSPALAEGTKLQDTLRVPDSPPHNRILPIALLLASTMAPPARVTLLRLPAEHTLPPELCWTPTIEKRPPPASV